MTIDLTSIRTEYARAGLHERDVALSPLVQLERWVNDSVAANHPEPTAMTLSTVRDNGDPAARVVLLKGLDARGLVFFTHYESHKGHELERQKRAAASFFWVLLERQVRVTGAVERVTSEESDAYFRLRPRESQLGAWASPQSQVLRDREELESRVNDVRARFGNEAITRPPTWGGYRLIPSRVEFWQGRPSRLHDRLCYERTGVERNKDEAWQLVRLAP